MSDHQDIKLDRIVDLLQKDFFDTVFVNYCYCFLSPVSYLLTTAAKSIVSNKLVSDRSCLCGDWP
ncbi:MAG: hypothetical protein F6K37_20985 [Moorea sp. SIO4E2]|uniref:hypothetical protein n=1 Tax=Moorena sp. SIO4E2 TaxID=2607826 RepID=UPI0013B760CB|nr:hypothetical protein [Moorena sp. SIO4E2]NEQ08330.1 hypothetical protein [Moorena sp. SIO4E2]